MKQTSHMRPACFLLWYAQHGRRSVVKTNARSVVRFLFGPVKIYAQIYLQAPAE